MMPGLPGGYLQSRMFVDPGMSFQGDMGRAHPSKPKPSGRLTTYFASEDNHRELLLRQAEIEKTQSPQDPSPTDPTLVVDKFHSLVLLSSSGREKSLFGFPSLVYKAFSDSSDVAYALRRLAGARLTDKKSMMCVDAWKKIQHVNVITLQEVFTTRNFKDHSVVFVSEFHPGYETLEALCSTGMPVQEPVLWTFIIQIAGALRCIHMAGLACRVVDASKILVQGGNRILISGTCVLDVIQFDTSPDITILQQEDLVSFGRLIVSLATSTPFSQPKLKQSLDFIGLHFSEDIFNVIRYLLAPGRPKNVNELMPIIGARFFTEIETRIRHADALETDLGKELHCGRLFRLASKLMFVVGRTPPEGDFYLLSLFKDHVFHQVDEEGQPIANLAHVVQALNKLDVASPESVMLFSPDAATVLMVTYNDLNRCLYNAFEQMQKI